MSNLSELLPSGGGAKSATFVASGTLPNGKAVVLKANGQVEVVGLSTPISESIPTGSAVLYNAAGSYQNTLAFDPTTAGRFVVIFYDSGNSNSGTAIVGTVSGTSVTFGSEYVFLTGTASGSISQPSISFDTNTAGRFAVAYEAVLSSNYGNVIIGNVSGTSISFGTVTTFNSASTQDNSIHFNPNTANQLLFTYRDGGNGDKGAARIGTVTGTSISFGTATLAGTTIGYGQSAAMDPSTAGSFVVCARNTAGAGPGTSYVGTISGTSISFGSASVFNAGSTLQPSISFDPNTAGKCIIAYKDLDESNAGRATIGTVSGSSITFGSEYTFQTANSKQTYVAFDTKTAGKFVITYRNGGASNIGTAISGTVTYSNSSIAYGTNTTFSTGTIGEPFAINVAFDPNNAGLFAVVYNDDANSGYGTVRLGQIVIPAVTNLTATNFVGITDQAIASGASGSVVVQGGVGAGQTSLTIGSTYYVQADGTISTVSTSPAVNIGKALSATTILLKG